MNTLRERIFQNYRYGGQPEYTEALLTSAPLDAIYQEIVGLLLSDHYNEFAETCFFVMDVVNLTHTPTAYSFRDGVYISPIIQTLEFLVTDAPKHKTRSMATYTLAKIRSIKSVDVLIQAFYRYLETDPLLVPLLLDEINWLQAVKEAPKFSAGMKEAIFNWNYLTRWAVVDHCYRAPDGLNIPYLEILTQDENKAIQAEANFTLALTQNQAATFEDWPDDEVLPPEHEARIKKLGLEYDEIFKSMPDLTFTMLEIRFWNEAKSHQRHDYHLMELMRFADTLIGK